MTFALPPPLILLLLLADLLLLVVLSATALIGYRMFRPLVRISRRDEHKVSIIVAAKEEADTLRESLASIMELEHQAKEVIIVCGPSSDGTESIAKEFEPRVTVLTEPERPKDWLGKSWACHQGYLSSTGDVLLFTDGDVLHSPESLGIALANLDSNKADLISAWPRIVTRATSESVLFPTSIFMLCAGVAASSRSTPNGRRVAGANGQYILVRRDVYSAIGGHAAIKEKIMEDSAMGRRTLGDHFEVINFNGEGFLKVVPYSRLGEMWEAHERFGAGLVSSWAALGAVCSLALAYYIGPFSLLLAGLTVGSGVLTLGGACGCAIVYVTDSFFCLKGSGLRYFLLAPVSGLLVTVAVIAGFVRFRRGGITWKRVKYRHEPFQPL